MTAAKLQDLALERKYIASLLALEHEFQATHLTGAERLDPRACSIAAHEQILEHVHELAAKGEHADWLTVTEAIERTKSRHLIEALTECMSDTDLGVQVAGMAMRLEQLARLRRTRELLMRAVVKVDAHDLDSAQELAREAVGSAEDTGRSTVLTIGQSAWQAAFQIQHSSEQAHERMNARTGNGLLDYAIKSKPRGTMHIIGGRTGCAKSSLMLNEAISQATEQGHRPGIVSCEDTAEVWGARALSYVTDLNSETILESQHRSGEERDRLIAQAVYGCKLLESYGIEMVYKLNRPLAEVRQAIRELVTQKRCTIVYVDYLQAIQLPGYRDHKREVSDAAQALKSDCQALGVALNLSSQLSRPSKDKPHVEPHMYDLKESGDLENMAESIVLLWKTSDEENAEILGKVAKVKWNARRPRFVVNFNPSGAMASLSPYTPPSANGAQPSRPNWGRS